MCSLAGTRARGRSIAHKQHQTIGARLERTIYPRQLKRIGEYLLTARGLRPADARARLNEHGTGGIGAVSYVAMAHFSTVADSEQYPALPRPPLCVCRVDRVRYFELSIHESST